LHVREPGYLPHLSYHSFRDADIFNYIPAIKYLTDLGYYVVRIGDKSMKRLPDLSEKFIDGPFCSAHCDFFDPYFISESEFYLGMFSGPINIAQAFGVPTLVVNGQISHASCVYKNGLLVPKQIYSEKLKRNLTYSEILNGPICDFYYAGDFQKNGLIQVECTPDEITASCREMILRLRGDYPKYDLAQYYQKHVNSIYNEAQYLREGNPATKDHPLCLNLTGTEIGTEFLEMNPLFLGHLFDL
jgi:putative glycosyltransferase (TIGR04372 family)